MVVSTTGAYGGTQKLCDSASRWELPPTQSGDNLHPTWRNLTGGDTFWASHITESAVYVGGHQRWANNPRPSPGGDNDGPGSVERYGIVALDPLTGVPLSWNPGRDRGRGAEAITSNDDFLFVGSDTDLFDGQIRQRLADLPVVGGSANPQPSPVALPVTLNFAVGSQLRSASFDGQTVGTASTTPGSAGISWSGFRDGFVQNGRLMYFGDSQAFYARPFSSSTIGSETNLSTTVGYVDTNYNLTPYDQPYGVAETTVGGLPSGRRPDLLREVRRQQALPPRGLARERHHRRLRVPRLGPLLRQRPGPGVRRRLALRGVEQRRSLPLLRPRRQGRLRQQPAGRRQQRHRLEPGPRSLRHARHRHGRAAHGTGHLLRRGDPVEGVVLVQHDPVGHRRRHPLRGRASTTTSAPARRRAPASRSTTSPPAGPAP